MTTMTALLDRGVAGRRRLGRLLALCLVACLGLTALRSADAMADFGLSNLEMAAKEEDGRAAATAAGHPFSLVTHFSLNTTVEPVLGALVPDGGEFKDVVAELPAGLVGNPTVATQCTALALRREACPVGSQIGVFALGALGAPAAIKLPMFNMVPPRGVPAEFAFNGPSGVIVMDAKVAAERNYAITITARNSPQGLPINDVFLEFWGVPAAEVHDLDRGRDPQGNQRCSEVHDFSSCHNPAGVAPVPFLTNTTECGQAMPTDFSINSWSSPTFVGERTFLLQEGGSPVPLGGCDSVPFAPTIDVEPTSTEADSPTGLAVDVHLPQEEGPEGIGTSDLRDAVVTLPEGMSVNPSSANQLEACSEAQIGLGSSEPATCPDASKLGSAEIHTPLLDHPIKGGVYLARQGENKFGSLLAIYMALDDPQSGVTIKLPGKVETTASGRVTARFSENPQLPFEDLDVEFFGGPRASLRNPESCGDYAATAEFTPWSGTAPVRSSSSFAITGGPGGGPCPDGGFDPRLNAGTTNPVGGSYAPFQLEISRQDGTQQLSTINAKLPAGVLAKLAGIPYCSDDALAGIPTTEGTGAGQAASPSCPAASQVGTVTVGAGAGVNPFQVKTGKAYLAGPYKGAPLSMAFVTPAIAGPFDLGNVVVRAALEVNVETAQVTAVSDPLPTVLDGIPLDIRRVLVDIDRDGFTLNPTSCEAKQVAATVGSVAGRSASPTNSFQVGSCESLAFQPKLALSLKGQTRRAGHPALKATLTFPQKGRFANISRAQVGLPHSLFLDQGNLNNVCKQADLKAGTCPPSSVYGRAKAWTPLLDKPLEGPVYLGVGYGHKLPDLVADLNGQIRILLNGRVDTTKQHGLRNTFEAVPDAPVSKFTLELKGGKKYGLIENSENLCKSAQKASVQFTAHNGKTLHLDPKIGLGCKAKGKKKGGR